MSDSEAPLNVWSRGDEEIGRLLSNFAHTPFVLDGVAYASVEAFYGSILMKPGSPEQVGARALWGLEAKRKVPRAKPEALVYQGRAIRVGSAAHHGLIKRAIAAKLDAHPAIARAFAATAPRLIAHETGRPDPPGAEFTKEALCRILTELRDDLVERFRREG